MSSELDFEGNIRIIELNMMDKQKYIPLTAMYGFAIRGVVYPVNLIKTRLQIQRHATLYKGTFDAFMKISQNEGASGLYRGFWINSLIMIPSLLYITSYESLRRHLISYDINNSKFRSFIAGGAASCLSQTLSVPIDILSQHLMLLGSTKKSQDVTNLHKLSHLQTFSIPVKIQQSRLGAIFAIIQEIYKRDRIAGFYRGYFMSVMVFVPNSALWWLFYDTFSGFLTTLLPENLPRLSIMCLAAPLSGAGAALFTNPLDLVRARMQVDGTKFLVTVEQLWREERQWLIFKGLSARLIQSMSFSFLIVCGYETIKWWSLTDDYKKHVKW